MVSDFNSDGLDDIIYATGDTNNPVFDYRINIHLQNSNGVLNPTHSFSYPENPTYIIQGLTVEDVNNDKLKDIIIICNDTLTIYFQTNIKNVFKSERIYSEKYTNAVQTRDFNSDGLKDIVISNGDEKFIKVFYQKANGFDVVKYSMPKYGGFVINIADMNADGFDDIVVLVRNVGYNFYIYLQDNKQINNNPITFTAPNSDSFSALDNFTIGDLNNDGFNDIAAVRSKNSPYGKLDIYYNTKQKNLFDDVNTVQKSTYDIPYLITASDLNCDGKLEIILNHPGWIGITIYEQDSNGQYQNYQKINCNNSQRTAQQSIVTSDFNNDGKKDIVMPGYNYTPNGRINIFSNESLLKPNGGVKKYVNVDSALVITNSIVITNFIKIKKDSFVNFKTILKDSFEVKKKIVKSVLKIDSTIITSVMYCSKVQTDTVKKNFTFASEKIIGTDTILIKTQSDTIYDEIDNIFIIYPNPTLDKVSIKSKIPLENNSVEIDVFDILGRRLINTNKINIKFDTIDFSNFPQATYILTINHDNKKKSYKLDVPVF